MSSDNDLYLLIYSTNVDCLVSSKVLGKLLWKLEFIRQGQNFTWYQWKDYYILVRDSMVWNFPYKGSSTHEEVEIS